jgi:hypothetical protein
MKETNPWGLAVVVEDYDLCFKRRDSIRVGKDEARAVKNLKLRLCHITPGEGHGKAAIEFETRAAGMTRRSSWTTYFFVAFGVTVAFAGGPVGGLTTGVPTCSRAIHFPPRFTQTELCLSGFEFGPGGGFTR